MDIQALISSWFYPKGRGRAEQDAWGKQQVINPYDSPNALIEDMLARGIRPWSVETIDLSVAGSRLLKTQGYHFVIYGHDNTPNKAVNTTAYVEVWWGDTKKQFKGFPAKHARGLTGPFDSLYIEWPAQNAVFCDIVVHSGMFQPWVDGESCT